MAKQQTKHSKGRAGERVSYSTMMVKGHKYNVGTVTRGGQRWRFIRKTKGEVEALVEEKIVELENEGADAESLTGEAKRDAAKARRMLGSETAVSEVVQELLDCRRLLGLTDANGKPVGEAARELAGAVKMAVAEYALARAELGGRTTVREAASFWAARNPDADAVTLGDARAAFLVWERREKEVEPSSANRLEARLEAFAKWLGGGDLRKGDTRAVASIEASEMEAFLDAHQREANSGKLATTGPKGQKRPRELGFANATRRKWRVTFRHFFGWAAKRYHLAANPAEHLPNEMVKRADKPIVFLRAKEVEKILRAAEQVAPEYVPAVAILFFAGLRPWELAGKYEGKGAAVPGLDWRSVDRDGHIVVEGETAKTGQRRTVPMEANLKAWVDAYAPERREGQVARNPIAWRRARWKIEEAAGVAWPADVARHTYASMHFAKFGNRDKLEANMGHVKGKGGDVLERHYKGLAEPAEAAQFWSIMPTGQAAAKKEGDK